MKSRGMFKNIICTVLCLSLFTSTVNAQASQRVMKQAKNGGNGNSIESSASNEFNMIKQKQKVSEDPSYNRKVQRVGLRIVEVARRESPELPTSNQWEFVVLDDCTCNAFALPGGRVGVNSGLLDLTANDDELAAVLGHEVAHVAKRHGQQRMSQNLLVTGIGLGLAIATLNVKSVARNGIMAAYGVGSSVGVLLPFSRSHETEADYVGLHYMAKAGYDPHYAISFWQKMEAQHKSRNLEFLSTHPSDNKRIKRLQEWLPEAMVEYRDCLINNPPARYRVEPSK